MLLGVRRAHFHELMQLVHRSLHELRASVDPLAATAERLAEGTHLLFLDELEVTDVVCAPHRLSSAALTPGAQS